MNLKNIARFVCMSVSLLASTLYGQNCKFEENSIDPFSKEKRLLTEELPLWKNPMGGNALSFAIRAQGNGQYLKMRYSHRDDVFSIKQGQDLMFLLSNDSTVTLSATSTKVAEFYQTESMGTIWYIIVEYTLSENERTVLSQTPVSLVRFYTVDGYIEKAIKPNMGMRLIALLDCIQASR